MASFAVLALAALPSAYAWGNMGHQTVAYIASNYVQASTQSWAQKILSDDSDDYLANVATWADTYRYTSAGAFSAPYHFIDANDNPPSTCNVDFNRDCGTGGCSVSAIHNYTLRVQSTSLSKTQINYALRFIIHFLGDITQPLHDEAYEYGANDVDVTFNGNSTNLHHTWDTNMPTQLLGGSSQDDAASWAQDLINEIDNGQYSSQKSSWVANMNLNDPQTTAMNWATDANQYVCSVVMPNGATPLESGDLYPNYYNSAIGTVELQIAKGGYRLAKWLDLIAANVNNKKAKRNGEADLLERAVLEETSIVGRPLVPRSPKSKAQLVREARGYACGHDH